MWCHLALLVVSSCLNSLGTEDLLGLVISASLASLAGAIFPYSWRLSCVSPWLKGFWEGGPPTDPGMNMAVLDCLVWILLEQHQSRALSWCSPMNNPTVHTSHLLATLLVEWTVSHWTRRISRYSRGEALIQHRKVLYTSAGVGWALHVVTPPSAGYLERVPFDFTNINGL